MSQILSFINKYFQETKKTGIVIISGTQTYAKIPETAVNFT